jgi:phage tail sheath protein FI
MGLVMKTPGVYIKELNAFPNSVVEVATAVPAFIGYTQKADNKGTTLHKVPWSISSMAEYINYFGGPPPATFNVSMITPPANPPAAAEGENPPAAPAPAAAAPVKSFSLFSTDPTTNKTTSFDYQVTRVEPEGNQFLLYYSMLLFFQNGGGPCYIVSVGSYADGPVDPGALGNLPDGTGGLDLLEKEQEPTMVVIPDAVRLKVNDYYSLQQASLLHCGDVMKSRVAIIDIYDGYKDQKDPTGDCVAAAREGLGTNNLDFGAAYYPWLNTTIVTDSDLNYQDNIVTSDLVALLNKELDLLTAQNIKSKITSDVIAAVKPAGEPADPKYPKDLLNKSLAQNSAAFASVIGAIEKQLNVLPPSPAIAGVYTFVDGSKGVWKAPANVSLNSVVSPTVNISDLIQEDLNVDVQGKSINAIRSFIGEGVLVWGGRTLDGNSLDWRYVQVRRTMIMLEQSIKLAAKAYVFENNVSTTWVTVKSMIRNFLTGIWKQGGLQGSSPDDAFQIFCGLGETMTADDILEGILRVTVLVAMIHPAEFIEITFQQQLAKS